MSKLDFSKSIEEAALVVGKTWPLYSFVTSNPLTGYEENTFKEAIKLATEKLESVTLPSGMMFRQAWQNGEIDPKILQNLLVDDKFPEQPEFYLGKLEAEKPEIVKNPNHLLDTIMVKWLNAFLDEGIADWEMPNKELGFYAAWRKLAVYDQEIGVKSIRDIPETANETLNSVLNIFSSNQQSAIFKYHIAALPGYAGYIKYRMTENSVWQAKFPISLEDYLAVRLWIAKQINAQILAENNEVKELSNVNELKYLWLKAWEKTYQIKLVKDFKRGKLQTDQQFAEENTPLAQLVFCIDTRSELIRKQIEAKNNYETFGYAGFFGLATDYQDLDTGYVRKSCPPIVASAYKISECANGENADALMNYKGMQADYKFADFLTTRMKNMLPSAFGYVEGMGIFYGFRLMARTLFPSSEAKVNHQTNPSHEHLCTTEIHPNKQNEGNLTDITLQDKVAIVKSAFDLLGWKKFAPIVVFVGHGSHSTNNPFASSLDCGACAASPGRHNARMLAKMANLPEVRTVLSVEHGIDIPEKTIFIGAEHDTTTDCILLFDNEISSAHELKLSLLKLDLAEIQESTIAARIGMIAHDTKKAHKKSSSWAETRPEWGLARNAGFIVGPRQLTKNLDLKSRCFLHSYNWELDENGTSLETIMQGPMVVTQWINNHYYFSTVDNEKFGGGSKITHNVVGKFGVVQGNGGDLKFGLPLQSVNSKDQELFHQPLRLSVIIQAPIDRVREILDRNLNLKSLLQNEWIYLLIMDPILDNQIYKYTSNGSWSLMTDEGSILATAV